MSHQGDIFETLLDFGIWLQYGKLQSRAERSANRSTARKFCCSPSPLHVVWNVGNFSVLNCKSAVLNLVLCWHCCIALLYRKSVKNRNYRLLSRLVCMIIWHPDQLPVIFDYFWARNTFLTTDLHGKSTQTLRRLERALCHNRPVGCRNSYVL